MSTVCRLSRVDRLFNCLNIVEDSIEDRETLKRIFKKWLCQIPAVIIDRKVPRLVLVLIGPSHIGKTHYFRNMLPKGYDQYYAESALNRGTDTKKLMCEKLIINNDEFGGLMRHNEMEEFKQLSSAAKFDERLPYGRFNTIMYRKAILCGTSNRVDVISDHTKGNTRIIPIDVNDIDRELYNTIDQKKLLAQIINEYDSSDANAIKLDYDEVDWLKEYSRYFMTENPEKEALLQCFEPGDEPKSSVEIAEALQRRYGTQRINPKKLATELKNAGFIQKRVSGQRKWMVCEKDLIIFSPRMN